MAFDAPTPVTPLSLADLEARAARDLAMIAHPRAPWVKPREGPDGRTALDVLVVGGGQSGLAVAFGLRRSRVDNILVVDRAAEGHEGPWRTYARMPTLRSPKDFTGPDLDVPSLTYEAWHVARFGEAHWQALAVIPRELWADYLLWVRKQTGVPVENGVAVTALADAGDGLIGATLAGTAGERTVFARRVVLATGQECMGRWAAPAFLRAMPEHLWAVTDDPIPVTRYAGKVVAVLGAGASALDNAAAALEGGASEVHLFCRRKAFQVVQPYRWLTFAGFMRHIGEMDDAWRWRFMSRILGLREGFPQATWDRCAAHPRFRVRLGESWTGAREADGRLLLDTGSGRLAVDLAIACIGIEQDFALRPELAGFAGNIATWADRYTPPPEERDDRLAAFPYLGDDFCFLPKDPALTPWMRQVHLFAIGSTMSQGPSGSSINAMTTMVPKLVHGLTRALFAGSIEEYWSDLERYDVPQAVVGPPPAT
jgi:cation diffusion facilitator CzcD-associated flavoprotein CzcO